MMTLKEEERDRFAVECCCRSKLTFVRALPELYYSTMVMSPQSNIKQRISTTSSIDPLSPKGKVPNGYLKINVPINYHTCINSFVQRTIHYNAVIWLFSVPRLAFIMWCFVAQRYCALLFPTVFE